MKRAAAKLMILGIGIFSIQPAFGWADFTQVIENETKALSLSAEISIPYEADLLSNCQSNPRHPIQVCTLQAIYPIALPTGSEAELFSLPASVASSSATQISILLESEEANIPLKFLVGGQSAFSLTPGRNYFSLPNDGSTNLVLSVSPLNGTEYLLRKVAKLKISQVKLHRGFDVTLQNLRAHAHAILVDLNDMQVRYTNALKFDKFIGKSRADLQRLYDAYVVNWEHPLPHYNQPEYDPQGNMVRDEFGAPVRKRECPLLIADGAEDGQPRFSHTIDQCVTLSTVTDLLANMTLMPTETPSQIKEKIISHSGGLLKIVFALEKHNSQIEPRFKEKIEELRAQGILE
jgi:hypothetical protein